ncbi:transcription repressor NadR [Pradoshia eiseniae]|uniref:Transcription repressor NadR n=1 Tax=Pradoshia eiseniae TaxID=2064768 RepID=A0A2S7N2Y0_9BACI|nr:transcription repressor NadR [Pradoshia eiseniae]PQD96377.1 transcription repressor NadR [Pradoshia eiseniae]
MEKKYSAEERRDYLVSILKEETKPIKGGELAKLCSVSRQIIVGDITLLKARNHPIIATPNGYLYLQNEESKMKSKSIIIASEHLPEDTEKELQLIVDCGVTVKDVRVEHPLYGDLTASIMVSNRSDVRQFIMKLKTTNAALLSQLTNGIHLHTLEAQTDEQLQHAIDSLRDAGFLIE